MVGLTKDIAGAKELDKAFKQLPRATAKSVLRRALKKAAKPTAVAAESLAPLGPTGNLRASIEVSPRLKKSQRRGGRPEGVELYIGSTAPHAHLLEFGTVNMPAHPFLRPAWDSTKQRVLDAIESEIWESLSKAARTLAKKAQAGTLGRAARRTLGGR